MSPIIGTQNIMIEHSLYPPPLLPPGGRKSKFWLPLPRGGRGDLKNLKRGGSMVQGQVFLKGERVGGGGDGHLRFIIFTFRNYFALCKVVSCIWRKLFFSATIILWQKGHSKLSKNEPENIPLIKITNL